MSDNEFERPLAERRVAERFFERQRLEIMGRIAEHETRRRARRSALPLAAALLIGALLSGVVLLRGPAPRTDARGSEWVLAWSLPAEMTGSDPLAAYEGPTESASAEEAEFAGPDLLPPLFDEIENTGDAAASADRG